MTDTPPPAVPEHLREALESLPADGSWLRLRDLPCRHTSVHVVGLVLRGLAELYEDGDEYQGHQFYFRRAQRPAPESNE